MRDGQFAAVGTQLAHVIATGRDAGRRVVTLHTLPGDADPLDGEAGKVGGFSLHAGVATEAHEGQKLERLCRYIARPAISERRLSISPQGRVRYALKPPWRNGTTHVEFKPVEFIAKLAALVPPPRAHLTRFHGIFAPNAALRAQLTSSGRGKGATTEASANADHRTPDEKRRSMTWAQRLKRVFGIDVDTCEHCGGAAEIIASVEASDAIRAILGHFAQHAALAHAHYPTRVATTCLRIPRAAPGNVPNPRLAPPPATPQTARKWRLNFLCPASPVSCFIKLGAGHSHYWLLFFRNLKSSSIRLSVCPLSLKCFNTPSEQ